MTQEQLTNIKVLSTIIIKKGYYEGEKGTFYDYNDSFIFINIKGSTVLFPIEEYLEYIEVI